MDQQLSSNWAALMNSFLALAHPLAAEITAPMAGLSYYWSTSQSMYDKAASVLRVETTIVRPAEFTVYRSPEGQPKQPKRRMKLRKGVCDMYRRAQVCRAANTRYLEALAWCHRLKPAFRRSCRSLLSSHDGKRYRGLIALVQKDHALLLAVSRGEFALNGMRNADLRALLYPSLKPTKLTKAEIRRRSAAVTRQLALLRAHGLLRKMPHSHRYLLSSKGRRIITALLAACYADVEQLTKIAA